MLCLKTKSLLLTIKNIARFLFIIMAIFAWVALNRVGEFSLCYDFVEKSKNVEEVIKKLDTKK